MKKLLSTILLGAFTFAAALPAFAGPDWQLIDKARAEKQAAATKTGSVNSSGTAAAVGCRVERLALPPDHGPRAQATPYQNEQRKARRDAQLKGCPMATK